MFETSYDKANRTSAAAARGVGLEAALPVFAEIPERLGLPVLTDVHERDDCAPVAAVDVLQILEGVARQRAQKKVAVIAPLALEAVRRMDELFAIEREMNGRPAAERLAVRSQRSAPIVAALEDWMRAERARLPGAAPVAKAMNYMLDRWPSFARFLDDGRVCMTNNGAERALRGLALGRKAGVVAG